jgi:hypothetical protein
LTATLKEAYPLSWPSGWPRTRPQDQKPMGTWKRTANQYREGLMTELERMGSPSFVISSNVPVSSRGSMVPGIEPRDVGVAVYFSRALKEDFSWQNALGITDPYPTEDQVNDAFKRLAKQYHPDTGVHRNSIPAMIYKLNKAGLLNKNGGRFSLKQL